MSSPATEKVSVLVRRSIFVFDASNVAVTGLVNANFTKKLSKDGATSATAVTVTEVDSVNNPGEYSVTFTPVATGAFTVSVYHATYNLRGWHEDVKVTTDGQLSAAATASAIWNAAMSSYSISGSFGSRLQAIRVNTVPSLATDQYQIVLDAGANVNDDFYNGSLVVLLGVAGDTMGEAKRIIDYRAVDQTATVDSAWVTSVGSGEKFMILPGSLAYVDGFTSAALSQISSGLTLSATERQAIADAILVRDLSNVEATAAVHSLCTALLKLVSRFKATTGETFKTDGVTVKMTQIPVNDAITPISELGVGT